MRIKRQFTAHLVEQFAKRGMLAELAEMEAEFAFICMARPDIGEHEVPRSFARSELTVEPTPWFNKWWAKLLRHVSHQLNLLGHRFPRLDGMLSHFNMGLRLPAWLDSLVYSRSIHFGYETERLPEDTMERIKAMANYLQCHENRRPSKVIMGRKALAEMQASLCADYWPITIADYENPFNAQVFGLEIQISPFLAEDEILVV
jgi:hypothetical protein